MCSRERPHYPSGFIVIRRGMKNARGVTLIELLVVITLLAVMATVAIPSYQYLVTNNQMTTHTNRLLGSLLFARSEAAKRGESVSVCRSSDPMAALPTCGTGNGWGDGWVVFEDVGDDGGFTAGNDTVLRTEDAISGGNTINSSIANYIRYSSDGRSNTWGSFTICSKYNDPDFTRQIDVSSTGRPRVVKEGTCP